MVIGLVGKKLGMTRVFTEDGAAIPVTAIEVVPNRVTQLKTLETDGYEAVQITAGSRKASHVTKSLAGHYAKAGVEAGDCSMEFRIEGGDKTIKVMVQAPAEEGQESGELVEETREVSVGDQLTVSVFKADQIVDVTGSSKGKGFQGGVKRHNFQMQDATHGNSLSHRAPGSIGQNQTPGRVFKGKKMAGHMGAEQVTTQNLSIFRVDIDRNLLLVRGAVPGAKGGNVIVRPTSKG